MCIEELFRATCGTSNPEAALIAVEAKSLLFWTEEELTLST
jgi:hypothetical protein